MPDVRSLRFRIGMAIIGVALLVWLFGAAVTVWVARQEAGEILDGQLLQTARLVATLPTEEFEEYEHQLSPPEHPHSRYEPEIGFQVWNRDGKLLFAGDGLPISARPVAGELGAARDQMPGGIQWRAVALESARTGHVVQVMAHRELGQEFAAHVTAKFARSALLAVPLALLVAAILVRQTLRPIETLRDAVAARDPATATPILVCGVPSEVAGLITAINGLAARHVELLGAVRRFAEDAAHELRTPIASIRAHAQVALGESSDEWQRAPLEYIESESARIAELLGQLLTMGQLDHAELDIAYEDRDLGSLVGEFSSRQGIESISLPVAACSVRCVPNLVEVALTNLLANARKHGGPRVRVDVFATAGSCAFAVEDDGPGVPEELRARMFEPFVRGPATRAEGSGLGLSIVRRIAALHGGSVRVEAGRTLRGARFEFSFG